MVDITLEVHGIRVVIVDRDMTTKDLMPHALVAFAEIQSTYRRMNNYPSIAMDKTEDTTDDPTI